LKRENQNMKKLGTASALALLLTLLFTSIVLAIVNNGNFETGDFTGWTKSTFLNHGFNTPATGGSDFTSIVGGPAVAPLSLSDANTGGNLKFPAYGHYSAKVNNELSYDTTPASLPGHVAKNGNTISQNVTAVLDPTDGQEHIRFTYAAVMVNPVANPHTADEKPYFRVQVINTSKSNDVVYDFSSYVGEPGKNWQNGIAFETSGDFWQYLDWTFVDLVSSVAHPVSAGDVLTINITAAGCSLGGHPGYVYVDEITDGDITGPIIEATGPATGVAGGAITYTYHYKNGSVASANLTIAITPPTNVTFDTLGDAVHCSGLAPVACTFNGVAANGSGSFTVSGTIASAAAGTTIAHGDYTIASTGFPTIGGPTVLTTIPSASPVTVTINQRSETPAQADPTNTAAIHFTVRFSEPVTGFTGSDVNLSASTTKGTPIATVKEIGPKDGTTYDVLVTGMIPGTATQAYKVIAKIPAGVATSVATSVTNDASTSTDNRVTFNYIGVFFFSIAAKDGWLLETSSGSGKGGTLSATAPLMMVGDDASNRAYRAVMNFDTTALPDNAVIGVVNFRIKQQGITGTNPLTTHGLLQAEIKTGFFGASDALETTDFQAKADKGACNFDTNILPENWYRCVFFGVAIPYVDKAGITQMRIRFATQNDGNNSADLLNFYAGENSNQYYRPELFVNYYFPAP
jgi:hypothetical protein